MLPVLIPQPRTISIGNQRGADTDAKIETAIVRDLPAQGYRIFIRENRIAIESADAAGDFYARQTLAQLRRQFEKIPALRIEDWPDFPARGFMLDISRDKVPTMATLFSLVDQLAELKINQLQLYTEHTFAYREHSIVWENASPMTADEIRSLDVYCRERFIELVPNQNSFGHLERWFKHPQYQYLAEQPAGFTFPWGTKMPTGFSLNPTDAASLKLLENLYDELLPNFSSRTFNVGCDETFDVGLGRSKSIVDQRGRERVYLDFILQIYQRVRQRDRAMMFWGDIILHKPELISELPKELIALNWGYEASHPFEKETAAFREAGIPFYVCPGTSSWCSFVGRTDNAIANLKNAAIHGLRNGAIGYLITDWGDHGHLQYLPISYVGLAAGAASAWCFESNENISFADAINIHILRDRSGIAGNMLLELGNVYRAEKKPLANGSRIFWTLIGGGDRQMYVEGMSIEQYEDAADRVARATENLDQIELDRADGNLVRGEIANNAAMLRHACRRGALRLGKNISSDDLKSEIESITIKHRQLWLERNRAGGLNDSAARLETAGRDYITRE